MQEAGIRVNAVPPGPVWTPLIPASMPEDTVATFGADTHMGRPAQPEEIAPSYVFLAGERGHFFTGQVLHPKRRQAGLATLMGRLEAITPRLPDFRLETYFSRWEFAAEHHLTASDAQTHTISEVLALGTEEDRTTLADLPLGYTET